MDDIERLFLENAPEPVEPSPAFELRLLDALDAKQRELGRPESTPAAPPSPRGARISLVALSGVAAGLIIGISLGRYLAVATTPSANPLAERPVTRAKEPTPPQVMPPEPTSPAPVDSKDISIPAVVTPVTPP